MKLSRYAASVSLAVLLAASAGSAFAATPVKLSGHVAKWGVAKSAMVGAANEGTDGPPEGVPSVFAIPMT